MKDSRLEIRISQETKEKLKVIAAEKKISLSKLVRTTIEQYADNDGVCTDKKKECTDNKHVINVKRTDNSNTVATPKPANKDDTPLDGETHPQWCSRLGRPINATSLAQFKRLR